MRRSLFAELRRRNVLRMAGLYLIGSWLITQVAATLLPAFEAPAWALRALVMLLAIGSVPTMMFSWIYELTPEGLKRDAEVPLEQSIAHETGHRIDRMIIATLALALAYFAVDKFLLAPRREAAQLQQQAEQLQQGQKTAGDAAAATAQAVSEHSIAVLPFVNMSEDKANEYFSDGISEELLNLLAKIPQLQVTARTSSFAFKGKEIGVPDIARTLHVAHVLEGSVRKAGNSVRITAQLIKAGTDTHLWSQTYDRKLDDIFKVQDEIAAAVVEQLKIKLLGAVPTSKPVDAKAYALILQAKALADQHSTKANQEAIALYKQSLQIAADEPRAWDGLAQVYMDQESAGDLAVAEGSRLAREAVNKALAADQQDATTYSLLGQIAATYDSDFVAAARYYQKSLDLEPGNPDILLRVARYLQSLGRFDDAIAVGRYIVATLDPKSSRGHYDLGLSLYFAGHWNEAIASFRTALALSPQRSTVYFLIGVALLQNEDGLGALAEMQAETSEFWRMIGLPLAYHALGRKAESDAALPSLIAKYEQDGTYNIAYVLAFRGEFDRAFEWLHKAVAYRDSGLSQVSVEPLFAKIHDDPRWLPFLREVGHPPEELAKIEFKVTLPQAEGATASGGSNK
jgi:TolB-like protein/Flp pilus assembly protein TadD